MIPSALPPRLFVVLIVAALGLGGLVPTMPLAPLAAEASDRPTSSSRLEAFGLLSAIEGWLLLDQRLYWTRTGGRSWDEITPSGVGALIYGVEFSSSEHGWLVLVAAAEDGEPVYTLARTRDGGQAWQMIPLALFQAGDPAAVPDKVHLHFLDEQTGWLVIKRATSRNFSVGSLFQTRDGGETWMQLTLPIGEPVRFVTPERGWVAGGAAGDELYQTEDGGRSWQALAPEMMKGSTDKPRTLELLEVAKATREETPLLMARTETHAALFKARDAGAAWDQIASLPAEISQFSFATPTIAWASTAQGRCAEMICTTETRLLRTDDGGLTWTPVTLPTGETSLVTQSEVDQESVAPGMSDRPDISASLPQTGPATPIVQNTDNTRWRTVTTQGFDSCTLPTLGQMQDWIVYSPYRVWNLYIGGSSRANCGTLTASYVAALAAQGWRLIPTWVGPQAPCSGFPSRMSFDPNVAYQQGVAEANAAVERAAALGLTFSNKSGTVLYYDLEAYFPPQGDTACRAAAQAFINGWTAQTHARGNLAGVYGATCSSYISDFVNSANVPDAVWLAVWMLPYQYRSSVSLFNLPCLSNSLWINQQRLRQYSGGHNETWGATLLNIDSNTLDAPVADIRDLNAPFPGVIEMYRGSDYIDPGACSIDQAGWLNVTLCGADWNDQLSSLRLKAGWSVRVFRDVNLSGPNVCLVLSDPDLSNDRFDVATAVDNNTSSLKIYDNSNCSDFIFYLPIIGR